MSVLCAFCLCVCVISNQSTIKKPLDVSHRSKLDTLLHKTLQGASGTKVPRLEFCRSIIFSKITSNVARSHIQSKKQGKIKSSWSGDWRWERGFGNTRSVLIKKKKGGGLGTSRQLCKYCYRCWGYFLVEVCPGIWLVATVRVDIWTWIQPKATADWGGTCLNSWSTRKTQCFSFEWSNNLYATNGLVWLGHLHLKVRSTSSAAFRISLAISPRFVWISSKNFSFFSVSHKSLSFVTWNLI